MLRKNPSNPVGFLFSKKFFYSNFYQVFQTLVGTRESDKNIYLLQTNLILPFHQKQLRDCEVCGYISQTQGLVTTSTINSGVVTGFYVVLTPFFSRAINKTSLSRNNYMYSVLGFIGIVLISITDFSQIFGNIFTFICAIAYAMHIVFVERYVSNLSISQLMAVQSITGAILCLPLLNINEFSNLMEYILPIFFLGIVVNVGAFYLQLYGQKIIKATPTLTVTSLTLFQ